MARAPVVPEAAEVEGEVAVRAAVQARHPVVTVGVLPEGVWLVERAVPESLGELLAFRPDQGYALGTQPNVARLLAQEVHAFPGGRRAANGLLVNPYPQLTTRRELGCRLGTEVRVGDIIIDAVELLAVRLDEAVQTFMLVVRRNHDDAEILHQLELRGNYSLRHDAEDFTQACRQHAHWVPVPCREDIGRNVTWKMRLYFLGQLETRIVQGRIATHCNPSFFFNDLLGSARPVR